MKVLVAVEDIMAQRNRDGSSSASFWLRFPEFGGIRYWCTQNEKGAITFPWYVNASGKRTDFIWWDREVNSWIIRYLRDCDLGRASQNIYHALPAGKDWNNRTPAGIDFEMLTKCKGGWTGRLRLQNEAEAIMSINLLRVSQSRWRDELFVQMPQTLNRDGSYSKNIEIARRPRKAGTRLRKWIIAAAQKYWQEHHDEALWEAPAPLQ